MSMAESVEAFAQELEDEMNAAIASPVSSIEIKIYNDDDDDNISLETKKLDTLSTTISGALKGAENNPESLSRRTSPKHDLHAQARFNENSKKQSNNSADDSSLQSLLDFYDLGSPVTDDMMGRVIHTTDQDLQDLLSFDTGPIDVPIPVSAPAPAVMLYSSQPTVTNAVLENTQQQLLCEVTQELQALVLLDALDDIELEQESGAVHGEPLEKDEQIDVNVAGTQGSVTYAQWGKDNDDDVEAVPAKPASSRSLSGTSIATSEVKKSTTHFAVAPSVALASDLTAWADGPRTTVDGLNASYFYLNKREQPISSTASTVPLVLSAAAKKGLEYDLQDYSCVLVVEVVVRPDVPVQELLASVKEAFVDDTNEECLEADSQDDVSGRTSYAWADNELGALPPDRSVIKCSPPAPATASSVASTALGALSSALGIFGSAVVVSNTDRLAAQRQWYAERCEWDLLETHVCLSRELKQRVLLLRFYRLASRQPLPGVVSPSQLTVDDALPSSQAQASVERLSVNQAALARVPYTQSMLLRFSRILLQQQLSLSALYNSRLADILAMPTSASGTILAGRGFDDHFSAQLQSLCEEQILPAARDSFSALEDYLASFEKRTAVFVTCMQSIFDAHGVSLPAYVHPPPVDVKPGGMCSDVVLATLGMGLQEPTGSAAAAMALASLEQDEQRAAKDVDGMSFFLGRFTAYTAAMQAAVDARVARSIDVKNKLVVLHIATLAAYKRTIVGQLVMNSHITQRSPLGTAFAASFGNTTVNGTTFSNVIFEEELPRPGDLEEPCEQSVGQESPLSAPTTIDAPPLATSNDTSTNTTGRGLISLVGSWFSSSSAAIPESANNNVTMPAPAIVPEAPPAPAPLSKASLMQARLQALRGQHAPSSTPTPISAPALNSAPAPVLVLAPSPAPTHDPVVPRPIAAPRTRFDPLGEAVVLYYCAGLVNGLSPGTLYITQEHVCLLYGLSFSAGSAAPGVVSKSATSNSLSDGGATAVPFPLTSTPRRADKQSTDIATGNTAFVASPLVYSPTAAISSPDTGMNVSAPVPTASVSQTKKVYALSRLSSCAVRHTGMLGTGTLLMQFFGGATEVTFAPTFVDCVRLRALLMEVQDIQRHSTAPTSAAAIADTSKVLKGNLVKNQRYP